MNITFLNTRKKDSLAWWYFAILLVRQITELQNRKPISELPPTLIILLVQKRKTKIDESNSKPLLFVTDFFQLVFTSLPQRGHLKYFLSKISCTNKTRIFYANRFSRFFYYKSNKIKKIKLKREGIESMRIFFFLRQSNLYSYLNKKPWQSTDSL